MIKFETENILGKIYISFLETNESQLTIPIRDKLGNSISGISSYAIVGQDFKTVIIPKEIEDIEENAFLDCPNLEEVYLNNVVDKEIDLDKCFIKESNNILFIVGSSISKKDFHSDKYIIIRNSNVFFSPYTKYEEDANTIYVVELPDCTDMYIPDFYSGKEVSLEMIPGDYFDTNCLNVKRMRVPKNGFNKLSRILNLEEICFSSRTESIILPICNHLKKVILYDKVESFVVPTSCSYNDLEILTIDDSVVSLKKFKFEQADKSIWYKKIMPEKDGSIVYKGLLLDVPLVYKKIRYVMPNHIIFMKDALFESSELSEIVFNKKIKNISPYCFNNCLKLDNIFIPKNIKYIGSSAFWNDFFSEDFEDIKKSFVFEDEKSVKMELDSFNLDGTMI